MLPAEFPAARNSKSMVHAGTGRWRQKNGRPRYSIVPAGIVQIQCT